MPRLKIPPEQAALLTRLWKQENPHLNAKEIGIRMGGLSDKQVLARAEALHLPRRRSASGVTAPPYSGEEKRILREMVAQGYQSEAIAERLNRSVSSVDNKRNDLGIGIKSVARNTQAKPVMSVREPLAVRLLTMPLYADKRCTWPIGEPGTKSFRYCDEPTCGGRSPYCTYHKELSHRPKEAAA